MDDRLLNPREAADILGVSVETVNTWRQKGVGPRYVKLPAKGKNGGIRYRRQDLEDFAQNNLVQTTETDGRGQLSPEEEHARRLHLWQRVKRDLPRCQLIDEAATANFMEVWDHRVVVIRKRHRNGRTAVSFACRCCGLWTDATVRLNLSNPTEGDKIPSICDECRSMVRQRRRQKGRAA